MDLGTALAGTDALPHLEAAHDAAWDAVDAGLLELCTRRLAMLLDHRPTLDAMSAAEQQALAAWPSDAARSDRDRAALAFTEQYSVDVAGMPDGVVAELRTHLGDAGLIDFVHALLIVEQRMTLELAFEGVL